MRPGACAVITAPKPLRVLVCGPRSWGRKQAEEDLVVKMLMILRRALPNNAIVMHDGCPTGVSGLVDLIWWFTWGRPTEAIPPAWDHCGPECPSPSDLTHRKAVSSPAVRRQHPGEEDTFCYTADLRAVRALLRTSYRPDLCLAIMTPFARVTRDTARLAHDAGVETRRLEL